MSYDCGASVRGSSRLVAHRVADGRIDMELDSEVEGRGWFHVYDAYNDGVLSGPEDRVTIGGDKYIADRKTCAEVIRNATDVRGNPEYERLFQTAKENIVQSYAATYVEARSDEDVPPINNNFFGRWQNFTENNENQMCVAGFKSKEGDLICAGDAGQDWPVVTLVEIDYESYPDGMALLVGAVATAHLLNAAADHQDVDRDRVVWLDMLCTAYGRCHPFDHDEALILSEWQQLERGMRTISDSCSWSGYYLNGLQKWATSQLSDECVDSWVD